MDKREAIGTEESVRLEGDRLAELYRRYADDAARLAYLITGDRMLAEDLMQDAFVRLGGRLLHLRHPDGFEAYLRRTIVNLANSHFRRRTVERRFLERQAGAARPLAAEPDVAARETIRRALLTLPVRQRTAIALRYYLDLSDERAAEILRCRPATVRSLVFRAVDKLRPLIGGD